MPKHRSNRRPYRPAAHVAEQPRLAPAGNTTAATVASHPPATIHPQPATVYPRTIWLDQLTGHPRQAFTLCRHAGLNHVLYLRLRRQYWQGYHISIPTLDILSVDGLITNHQATWSADLLQESCFRSYQLVQARHRLIQSFLSTNHIDRRIYFVRPRP